MSEPVDLSFTVNEKSIYVKTAPDRPLLEVLREELHLTGAKYGCGEGAQGGCGACGVLIDGKRVFSCTMPVSQAAGKSITTIEGLADGDKLHRLQQAFLEEEAFQCGYCTGGMILAAAAMLKQNPHPDDAAISRAMNGNLCRCCAYPKIHNAIKKAIV